MKPCLIRACPNMARPNMSRCRTCEAKRRRDGYDHPDYRALGRASGQCRLRLHVCTGTATTWHHIVPLARGGGHHRSNVIPACGNCNSSKRDR